MAIQRATGYPDYTFDGNSKHIPILFSGKLLEKFYAKSTIANISTTDYVGELKSVGDRVVIRTLPNVTIRDYEKGGTLQLEYPDSPAITFQINRAKYFNFAMDDIDIKQSDISWIDKLSDDASMQMKIVIDREVFSTIYTKAHVDNQGNNAGASTHAYNLGSATTPLTLTRNNVIDFIIDCGSVLDEQNIPDDNRWIVLPPSVMNLISKSELRQAYVAGDGKSFLLRGGFSGYTLDRFNIYVSNLLYKTQDGKIYIPFGRKSSLVFVSQIDKVEKYRPQNTFSDAMKGLMVYDFDVINPVAFGVGCVTVAP